MRRLFLPALITALLFTATPVAAQQHGLGLIAPPPSYVPGYGRLVHDDPFVTVYDNTGQYGTATAKYRSRRRTSSSTALTNRREYAGREHCAFRPDAHLPKCFVYDDCTYEELYGDGTFQQCPPGDKWYQTRAADRRQQLTVGPLNRSRNYPFGTRDGYQYQNSYNHYDSYWGEGECGTYNTYEWYDY